MANPVEDEQMAPEFQRRLDLYIAGNTLTSRVAVQNLDLLRARVADGVALTVVDVLEDPRKAFQHGIFVTPSLIARDGQRQSLILGDLSDRDLVFRSLAAMGLVVD
jgi:hypothetical protein